MLCLWSKAQGGYLVVIWAGVLIAMSLWAGMCSSVRQASASGTQSDAEFLAGQVRWRGGGVVGWWGGGVVGWCMGWSGGGVVGPWGGEVVGRWGGGPVGRWGGWP